MLYIHGVGHFHPENEITNRLLEELDIGTSDEWIMERTGIRSRRTVLDLDYIRKTKNQDVRAADDAALYSNVELGRRASEAAIAHAGIDRSQIGMVLAGGTTSQLDCPAEACGIAAELEIEAPALDIRSACTSFGAAVQLLWMMDPSQLPDFVLVVNPETVTRTVDYTDRSSAVLWGDAAVAVIVSKRHPAAAAVVRSQLETDPRGYQKITIHWADHFEQDGSAVQKFAIKRTVRMFKELEQECQKSGGKSPHFIGHQANALMLENVCRTCNIPEERHHSNVADFGNTGTAGPITVLSAAWDEFSSEDQVAVLGVGAGLTWSSTLLRFGDSK
ncbi:MAG: ketoacyl-ACP synthase III [Acidobacteria bacterium]|nr:MAG: ketoacyl-ACP synthase III [Acidobacteriota bacterium]